MLAWAAPANYWATVLYASLTWAKTEGQFQLCSLQEYQPEAVGWEDRRRADIMEKTKLFR